MPSQFQFSAPGSASAATSPTIPAGTRKISVQNRGTDAVYVGVAAGVTAATGHVLAVGDVWTDEAVGLTHTSSFPAKPYFLSSTTGAQQLSVLCI